MELPVLEWLNSRNIEWESAFGNNIVFHSNNYTKGSILLICSPSHANFQLVMSSSWCSSTHACTNLSFFLGKSPTIISPDSIAIEALYSAYFTWKCGV